MFKNKKITAVLFARYNSKRLKGKLLKKINNTSLLEISIIILKKIKKIDNIILATTDQKEDQKILKIANKHGLNCYQGSENNVLERFYKAVNYFEKNPEILIRYCCENPLTSINLIKKNINKIIKYNYDLISMVPPSNIVLGTSPIFMNFKTLDYIYKNAKNKIYLEHVENYCYDYPEKFKIEYITSNRELYNPETNFSIDNISDFKRVLNLFNDNNLIYGEYKYKTLLNKSGLKIFIKNYYWNKKIKKYFKNNFINVDNLKEANIVINDKNNKEIFNNKIQIVIDNKGYKYVFYGIKNKEKYLIFEINKKKEYNLNILTICLFNSLIDRVKFWPPIDCTNLSKKISNSKSNKNISKTNFYNYFPKYIISNKKIDYFDFNQIIIMKKNEIKKIINKNYGKYYKNSVYVIDNYFVSLKKEKIIFLQKYDKYRISNIFKSYPYSLI